MGGDRQKKLPLYSTLLAECCVDGSDAGFPLSQEKEKQRIRRGRRVTTKKIPCHKSKATPCSTVMDDGGASDAKKLREKKKFVFYFAAVGEREEKKTRTKTQSATFCVLRAPSLQSRWCSGIGSACNTEAHRRGGRDVR